MVAYVRMLIKTIGSFRKKKESQYQIHGYYIMTDRVSALCILSSAISHRWTRLKSLKWHCGYGTCDFMNIEKKKSLLSCGSFVIYLFRWWTVVSEIPYTRNPHAKHIEIVIRKTRMSLVLWFLRWDSPLKLVVACSLVLNQVGNLLTMNRWWLPCWF